MISARIGQITCGDQQPLLIIAGPCVLEDQNVALEIAQRLCEIAEQLPVRMVFKASFDKANRTSLNAYRGPGLDEGLRMLSGVKSMTGLPLTTDIHETGQASPVGEVCDLIQIPAFLARQTDLLIASARTGKPVNVKKGQFMSPFDMEYVVEKLRDSGCQDILLTERGTFFGYGNLVNDMRGIPRMRASGVPVIFDATHSVQERQAAVAATGGQREMSEPLALAAVAAGADGVFFETHPKPETSPSDGANMVPLDDLPRIIARLVRVREALDRS